jgi:hypothetical protein
MKPTEAQCKMLTEFIGERHHRLSGYHDRHLGFLCICGIYKCNRRDRTFLTPDDIFKVKEALEEKGLFSSFLQYAFDNIEETDYRYSGTNPDEVMYNAAFISVLYGKDEDRDYRFCRLVAEYLKEGV